MACDRYLDVLGYWTLARKWATLAVQAMRVVSDSKSDKFRLSQLHLMRAKYQFKQGDYESAKRSCWRSFELGHEVEDTLVEAAAMHLLGRICFLREDYSQAFEFFNRSLDLFDKTSDKRGKAVVLHEIAEVHRVQGRYEIALNLYQESYDIKRELEDGLNARATLFAIGQVKAAQGDTQGAYVS